MYKRSLFLLLVLVLVLSACAPATTMPSFKPTEETTETLAPAETTTQPTSAASAFTAVQAKCVVRDGMLRTPDDAQVALAKAIPPVNENDWVRGSENAKITIVEYSDYMCPYCAAITPGLKQLLTVFPDDLRMVYRHFPLPSHNLSLLATQATESAGLQGKFWDMSDYLLEHQSDWTAKDLDAFETYLIDLAGTLSLDKDKFTQDLQSEAVVNKAKQATEDATNLGISYTPFLMVNGRILQEGELQSLGIIIDLLRNPVEGYKECPPTVVDPSKTYTATLTTDKGDIVIRLYADAAPLSVNSFVYLAKEGWYNNQPFNDVINDSSENGFRIAIAGDHTDTGYGSAGYDISAENLTGNFDKKGMVGFVNGSQFFITLDSQPALDGNFSVIGEVISGLDVLDTLNVTYQTDGTTLPADVIQSVTIKEE